MFNTRLLLQLRRLTCILDTHGNLVTKDSLDFFQLHHKSISQYMVPLTIRDFIKGSMSTYSLILCLRVEEVKHRDEDEVANDED